MSAGAPLLQSPPPRLPSALARRCTPPPLRAAATSYRFLTHPPDASVRVAVGDVNDGGLTVAVDASPPPRTQASSGGLVLSWATSPGAAGERMTPLSGPSPDGNYSAELQFEASLAPFYLSFVLTSPDSVIRSHRRADFRVPVGAGPGRPMPLGVSTSPRGETNFALYARNADRVVLCLFDSNGTGERPAVEIELDEYVNRTGNVWHLSLPSVDGYVAYGYRCAGDDVMLDPYATQTFSFGSGCHLLGSLVNPPNFDWGRDARPALPMEEMVVYRLNVGSFAGTFAGVAGKVEHLKSLGVNAVLLEPVFPFADRKGPYFPLHFFSPAGLYAGEGDGLSAAVSFKEMVKALHAEGIEVLLEVAFTGTGEDEESPAVSTLGGIDAETYIPGAGKSVSCNHPVAQQLILESLRHWRREFHVDGFCFVGADRLVLDPDGALLSHPPLIDAIAFDPVLAETKIIADPCSPVGVSLPDSRFPHWKRWAEMNTRYCSNVRDFLRGKGLLSYLATRLCGSGDLFSSRGPAFSFNYIARNRGLTLVDLVSFSSGEEFAAESSWNCGEEGATDDALVLETRLRQIRNLLLVLFVSLGVPVLQMGDECGHSAGGSLAYTDRQPLNWKSLSTAFSSQVSQFTAYLTSLRRRRRDIFQRKDFLKVENISWHGSDLTEPRWEDDTAKFLCMTLRADEGDLFMCFNAGDAAGNAVLPAVQDGSVWLRLVDTGLPFPGFFSGEADRAALRVTALSGYQLEAHCCAVFEAVAAAL